MAKDDKDKDTVRDKDTAGKTDPAASKAFAGDRPNIVDPPVADAEQRIDPVTGKLVERPPMPGAGESDHKVTASDKDVTTQRDGVGSDVDTAHQTEQQRQSADAAAVDEARARAEATSRNAEMAARRGNVPFAPTKDGTVLPVKMPRTMQQYLDDRKADGDKDAGNMTTVVVPPQSHGGTLKLRLDDHSIVEIPPGLVELPNALLDHWYLKANGVKPYDKNARQLAQPMQQR